MFLHLVGEPGSNYEVIASMLASRYGLHIINAEDEMPEDFSDTLLVGFTYSVVPNCVSILLRYSVIAKDITPTTALEAYKKAIDTYGIDIFNPKRYMIMIDTTTLSFEEIVNSISHILYTGVCGAYVPARMCVPMDKFSISREYLFSSKRSPRNSSVAVYCRGIYFVYGNVDNIAACYLYEDECRVTQISLNKMYSLPLRWDTYFKQWRSIVKDTKIVSRTLALSMYCQDIGFSDEREMWSILCQNGNAVEKLKGLGYSVIGM